MIVRALNAEHMRKVVEKGIQRRYKNTIKKINREIRNNASMGYTNCSVTVWQHFTEKEAKDIEKYYTSLGYKIKVDQGWCSVDVNWGYGG